jgi:hypothetical protein
MNTEDSVVVRIAEGATGVYFGLTRAGLAATVSDRCGS